MRRPVGAAAGARRRCGPVNGPRRSRAASAGQRAANDGTGLRDLYFAAGIRALTKAGRSGGSTGGSPERDSTSASAPASPDSSGPEVAAPHATVAGAAPVLSDEYDEPIADSDGADVGAALKASPPVSAPGTSTSEHGHASDGSTAPGVDAPSAELSPADMHGDPIADSEGVPPLGAAHRPPPAGAAAPSSYVDEGERDHRDISGAAPTGELPPPQTDDEAIAGTEGAGLRDALQGHSAAASEQPDTKEEGQ